MDKIPKSLIPITHRENGQYFSEEKTILKDWTVYHVEQNMILNDGHLDYYISGNSDIKMYKKGLISKQPYMWYVAKDNKPFKTPYYLKEEEESPPPIYKSPSASPRSRSRSGNSRGGNKSRFRRGTRRRNRRGTRRKINLKYFFENMDMYKTCSRL